MNKCAFETKVLEILRENGASRWRRHMDEGRLDPRSLQHYRTSPDVFRKKEIPGKKEYAVGFVLDASGSMAGPRADSAQLMALQFADSMNVLGIPFCISAFGSACGIIHRAGATYSRPELKEKLRLLYADAIGYVSGKRMWDVRYRFLPTPIRGCKKAAHNEYPNAVGGNTRPLPALVGCLEELLQFPGGKILVTMTDGDINKGFTYAPPHSLGSVGFKIQDDIKRAEDKSSWDHNNSPHYWGTDPGFVQLGKWMHDNGIRPLYMDLMSNSLTRMSQHFPKHIRPEDTFRVDNLAQGYDALVSKLSTEFNFDYDKKLR